MSAPIETRDRLRGCLLGGAVGDALGAPIEFSSIAEIRADHGPSGLRDLVPSVYGRAGLITDDTQMTLFTAEGLLRAHTRGTLRGIVHIPSVVWHAYQRWLITQDEPTPPQFTDFQEDLESGWLLTVRALHARRAPGNTCLAALRGGVMGTREAPINTSKGCGAVMRTAPVALTAPALFRDAGELAEEVAATTHGHPTAWHSAHALTLILDGVLAGRPLERAIGAALDRLDHGGFRRQTVDAICAAITLATTGEPTPEAIAMLGAGWIAEEALAIALYSALTASSFPEAVLTAVNHSGDSDSTGAIAGNIAGALYGLPGIPARWLEQLGLCDTITSIADDTLERFWTPVPDAEYVAERDWDRYPGC